MSLPSFPRSIPIPGTALCSAGSLRRGSPTSSLLLRCSDFSPLRPRSFCSRRRSSPIEEQRDLPGSWAALRVRATVSDPGGPVRRDPGRGALSLTRRYCLPRDRPRRPPQLLRFGALSRGPHARCLRFAPVIAHVCARLASARGSPPLRGRDFHPRAAAQSFRMLLPSSLTRLVLAHPSSRPGGAP
jgi:hypothetical protein